MFCAFMALTSFAQSDKNYSGGSKFGDNWSVNLQGGVITGFNDFFGQTSPIIVVGADKYVTPWLGLGVDLRTAIAAPANPNPHTAFDAVNVSGIFKVNVINLFNFNGKRRLFEPVIYTGLGWGHTTCSDFNDIALWESSHNTGRNYMTYRAGVEFNFNLGKTRSWAIVVNPSVVWGDICNGKLDQRRGNFELTAGVVYHFKTSNGTHSYTKASVYNPEYVTGLEKSNARLKEQLRRKNAVENRPKPEPKVERVVEKVYVQNSNYILFSHNSAELTDESKAILDGLDTSIPVKIEGYASPEGTEAYNLKLSQTRADNVAEYLKSRGINVVESIGCGVSGNSSNRLAIVSVVK